ncbi:unnamed protein product [Caenorhabditis angaria]|uniref:C2 domain-containing protein n=1 Tax=Caenorhabditis angaria TaxID=860376 RepID=A0A9P1MYD9_9PELO|nr:unnamed protein product [Caenorhabditis angaria]
MFQEIEILIFGQLKIEIVFVIQLKVEKIGNKIVEFGANNFPHSSTNPDFLEETKKVLDVFFKMLIFCTLIGVVLGEQFWLSAEVNSIDWREGCLTTALCSQPRFQLVKDLLPVNERVSVNWPISEHFVKDSIHPFVTYWPSGKLEDISLSAQVVGIDRTYGFPRICDQTPSIRMFPEEQKIKVLHHHKDHLPTTESPNPPPHPDDSLLLNIKGKCFNATLIITKHTERCPWCPDPKDISIINQEIGSDPNALKTASIYSIFSDERMVHLGVLILAVIAVISSTAFAIVLVMFLRNKRKMNEKKNKKNPRFHPYISVKGHEMIEDNNRYDMPWEQHNKPLTYWMTSSNKSDSTMTSPLDSASSLGQHQNELYHSAYTTRDGYQTYHRPPPPMFPPPQTQLFTSSNRPRGITSPISNDDSGLESV